jgi:hypothetical protein
MVYQMQIFGSLTMIKVINEILQQSCHLQSEVYYCFIHGDLDPKISKLKEIT